MTTVKIIDCANMDVWSQPNDQGLSGVQSFMGIKCLTDDEKTLVLKFPHALICDYFDNDCRQPSQLQAFFEQQPALLQSLCQKALDDEDVQAQLENNENSIFTVNADHVDRKDYRPLKVA
ncbi:hypothetical protein Cva_01627 [Caedimonas varicaedens]|uniref:Uncharacterized protein n=1 Tax=Caedimonas varicaedens TaxID=1629334 RepID=A0A0K8MET1_9PROT|nr:hypothetical protein Cva_01627 [Caedimonas varicaedens]